MRKIRKFKRKEEGKKHVYMSINIYLHEGVEYFLATLIRLLIFEGTLLMSTCLISALQGSS